MIRKISLAVLAAAMAGFVSACGSGEQKAQQGGGQGGSSQEEQAQSGSGSTGGITGGGSTGGGTTGGMQGGTTGGESGQLTPVGPGNPGQRGPKRHNGSRVQAVAMTTREARDMRIVQMFPGARDAESPGATGRHPASVGVYDG